MLFPSQPLTSFLHVSGVTQFISVIQFARHFVQYWPFSPTSVTRFINSLQFITSRTDTGGGLWIFFERGFPSKESSPLSFVNKPYRLCVSFYVSGVLCCVVLCCVVPCRVLCCVLCVVLCCVVPCSVLCCGLCIVCCVVCIFSFLVRFITCRSILLLFCVCVSCSSSLVDVILCHCWLA